MITFGKVWTITYGWFWMLLVLTWPLVKWGLSLLTFFHFLRMVYHWDTPGAHAWVEFTLYFLALTVLTAIVSAKPKK